MMLKSFTAVELAEYNGKNGKKAFTGYKGKVYDVTGSFHWKNGNHWVFHDAGCDLTSEMKNAPHFEDLLDSYEIVGILI